MVCELLLTHVILLKNCETLVEHSQVMEHLNHKGQNNFKADGIYFAFSWQWREWCWENREYEVVVAAHNEPMQRQLAAGAADPSGRSLQDGA